jgi:hypothetical protein
MRTGLNGDYIRSRPAIYRKEEGNFFAPDKSLDHIGQRDCSLKTSTCSPKFETIKSAIRPSLGIKEVFFDNVGGRFWDILGIFSNARPGAAGARGEIVVGTSQGLSAAVMRCW